MRCICTNSAWSEVDRGSKFVCEYGPRWTFWTTPSFLRTMPSCDPKRKRTCSILILPANQGDSPGQPKRPLRVATGIRYNYYVQLVAFKRGRMRVSHRVSFETGRNRRQLSPYNFVWETLKCLNRATPASTPVTASSLYNIFTITYRIVHRGIPLKLPFRALQLLYILFFKIYSGWAVALRAVLSPN
jgi:hypothetical protein